MQSVTNFICFPACTLPELVVETSVRDPSSPLVVNQPAINDMMVMPVFDASNSAAVNALLHSQNVAGRDDTVLKALWSKFRRLVSLKKKKEITNKALATERTPLLHNDEATSSPGPVDIPGSTTYITLESDTESVSTFERDDVFSDFDGSPVTSTTASDCGCEDNTSTQKLVGGETDLNIVGDDVSTSLRSPNLSFLAEDNDEDDTKADNEPIAIPRSLSFIAEDCDDVNDDANEDTTTPADHEVTLSALADICLGGVDNTTAAATKVSTSAAATMATTITTPTQTFDPYPLNPERKVRPYPDDFFMPAAPVKTPAEIYEDHGFYMLWYAARDLPACYSSTAGGCGCRDVHGWFCHLFDPRLEQNRYERARNGGEPPRAQRCRWVALERPDPFLREEGKGCGEGVPELVLWTPEGEKRWLVDIQYRGGETSWADLDDEDEDW